MNTGWLRAVIRQNRVAWRDKDETFIPDQNVYLRPGTKYRLFDLVEVRCNKYYFPAVIVGMGFEGDELVLNVL